MMQKLHLIGFPHTQTNEQYNSCAYTSKLVKFLKMFPDTIHYGNEGSIPCKNLVEIFSHMDLQNYFGKESWYQQRKWHHVGFDASLPYWKDFNKIVIQELKSRLQPGDIILTLAGLAHREIMEAFPANLDCEFGIGYEGVFSRFRVYESNAWMHYIYGKYCIQDGRFYDAVIPNYFDVNEFSVADKREDYLLFMSRPIDRKGLIVVKELAKYYRVISAGPEEIPGIEWAGYADSKRRNDLMSNARALLCPTFYVGPFEGVAVEAQLCGTPVVTTDFGAFKETVLEGITGFRCSTFQEFFDAIEKCDHLDRNFIRHRACSFYSLEAVKPQYEKYFQRLSSYTQGWWPLSSPQSKTQKRNEKSILFTEHS